jgi:Phosphatidylinositol N-acetylglucosaminyltransferase
MARRGSAPGTRKGREAVVFGTNSLLKAPRLTSVLSMNAAISASVVLASRLSTNVAVFALTLFSVQSFALFPILRVRLQVVNLVCSSFDCFELNPTGGPTNHSYNPYSCVVCGIPLHHYTLIAYCGIPLSTPAYLNHLDCPRRSCLGSKVQKVSSFRIPDCPRVSYVVSEIRGPWDVAVPQVR